MRLRTATAIACGLLLLPAAAYAQDEDGGTWEPPPSGGDEPEMPMSHLSETETSFVGAVMLVGDHDVTIEDVVPGAIGNESDRRYAYFSGNTLYIGGEDMNGNSVDLIAEFFWFESSVPRGSDFYVAVLKARTSPNVAEGWLLEHDPEGWRSWVTADQGPALYVRATTDPTMGLGGFRWDWSIPFDSYGWDAFGNVTMETSYGVGLHGEGAAQKAIEVNPEGVMVTANVQTKGFLNTDYRVQTRYEVTLYRWQVLVNSNAGTLHWQLVLHSPDREEQNAYHEYFAVMQADAGEPFVIDQIEVGGNVKNPRFSLLPDEHAHLSVGVRNLTLRQPMIPPPTTSRYDAGTRTSTRPDPSDEYDWPSDETDSTTPAASSGGCSVALADLRHGDLRTFGLGGIAFALAAIGLRLRRRSR